MTWSRLMLICHTPGSKENLQKGNHTSSIQRKSFEISLQILHPNGCLHPPDIQHRIWIKTLPMKRELMTWVQDLMGFLMLNVYLIAFYVIFPIWDPISWSKHPAQELNINENFRHLWNTKNSNRRNTAKGNKKSVYRVDEAFILSQILRKFDRWIQKNRCAYDSTCFFFVSCKQVRKAGEFLKPN